MGDRAIEALQALLSIIAMAFIFIWIGKHSLSPDVQFVLGNTGLMLLAIIILAVGVVAISVVTNSAE